MCALYGCGARVRYPLDREVQAKGLVNQTARISPGATETPFKIGCEIVGQTAGICASGAAETPLR